MALFVNDDKTINDPQSYQNILIDNSTKSIRIVLRDIEINHKLMIQRLYINENECYVNTTRGNFILNTEEPNLHLVFYNKRWFSIGRDSALPLLDVSIDRRNIINNQFQNCAFGEHFIQTKDYPSNNGTYSRYYISDRLLVAAKNYHMGQLGCIFVYSKDTNNEYTILEDMITIPYESRQGQFQGKFGALFEVLEMDGYHYLVVCAPNRRLRYSECSVYIYSYRKRSDNTFYFRNETIGREIVIPRLNTLRNLVVTKDKCFHLIYEQEIITYYISSYDSENINISSPYPVSTTYFIKDVVSTDTHVYVLSSTAINKYAFPTHEDALIDLTIYLDLSENYNIGSFDIDVSEGIVGVSDKKIYFFDNTSSNIITHDLSSNQLPIQSFDLYHRDPNKLIYLCSDGKVYGLTNKNTSQYYGIVNSIGSTSKIHYYETSDSSVFVGLPSLSDGSLKRIYLNTFLEIETTNYKNTSIQSEVCVSRDAEYIYIYDRRTKIISVLIRNSTNTFVLSHTIIADLSISEYLRFRDTILDVKINYNRSQILIGVKPYNDVRSSVLICDLESYSYLGRWLGSTLGFGTSIDIREDTAIVSDPNVSDAIINNNYYDKGTVDLYNLKPLSNFQKINLDPLRSSSPIGKFVKMSPNINELLSIGEDATGKYHLTMFSNIYDADYRKLIMDENVSDAEYFLGGRMVITNKDASNNIYKYQKVNGCFEIITKKPINIPEFDSVSSKITVLPLGKNYTFMYYVNTIDLFDIRDMKLIKKWNDVYTTNVSVSIDGSTISYANQTENGIEYIICS